MTTEATTPAAAPEATPAAEAKPESKASELFAPLENAKDAPAGEPGKTEQGKQEAAAKEQEQPTWFYADGVPGKGPAPDWYLADKYKTLDAQAKAYPDLQRKLGAFVGAPADGKYDSKLPEGLPELDAQHPLVGELQKWCKENEVSQARYTEMLGMLAQYEASQIPDMDQIKLDIGDKADMRIGAVEQWARANLNHDEYQLLREATTNNAAAKVFKLAETLIAKTRQVAMPKPGEDTLAANPQGEAGLQYLMKAKDSNGGLRYFTDEAYRRDVDRKMQEHFKAQA